MQEKWNSRHFLILMQYFPQLNLNRIMFERWSCDWFWGYSVDIITPATAFSCHVNWCVVWKKPQELVNMLSIPHKSLNPAKCPSVCHANESFWWGPKGSITTHASQQKSFHLLRYSWLKAKWDEDVKFIVWQVLVLSVLFGAYDSISGHPKEI